MTVSGWWTCEWGTAVHALDECVKSSHEEVVGKWMLLLYTVYVMCVCDQ